MSDINFKNDVRVSHELNHLRGAFTKLELDFTYSFISMIKKEDVELTNYTLTLPELEKKMERRLQLKDIEYLFDTLTDKEFKVENDKELTKYSFFTYLSFNKVNRTLTVDFNTRLKPHLLELKTFAHGNLKYIFSLKSEYSKRIYMIIMQWKSAIKSRPYAIQELRDLLEIPDKYVYADIKRRVLEKAKEELEAKSHYYFKYHENKIGRKVESIYFTVHENIKLKRAEEQKQGTLKGTEFNKNLEQFIGKRFYKDGYDWKIKSISTNGKLYSVYCYDIDRPSDTKHFEFSIEQLKQFKD